MPRPIGCTGSLNVRRITDGGAATTTPATQRESADGAGSGDRKSTRLNSSHGYISYAVFCLKKKKTYKNTKREGGTTLLHDTHHTHCQSSTLSCRAQQT